MIQYDDVLSFNFYTYGQAFSGSYKGMRYQIIRQKAAQDEEGNTIREAGLLTTIWPEPFCLEKTDDSQKTVRLFPYSDEGRRAAVDWLNEVYEKKEYL